MIRAARLALLALLAALLPLALADARIAASSYGRSTAHFELFAGAASLAAALWAALELRARRVRTLGEVVPIAAPLLVALAYATLLGEHPRRPFDYDCYEYAGRALLLGANPWVAGLNYLYPPLTAQAFALAHRGLFALAAWLGAAAGADAVWDLIFYLFQCAQLGLVLLLHALCVRLVGAVGLDAARAHALVALLLLVDNPLLRTLRHGQLNLWILDAALLALLTARRRPALAGAALALSIHLKLYPLVLLLPLALARCGRAIAWTGAALAGIALLQTDLGRDWTLWLQFADYYRGQFPGEIAFRNNGFHSLAFNTLRFATGAAPAELRAPLRAASGAFALAVAVWLGLRCLARERRGLGTDAAAPGSAPPAELRLCANGADALACSLLISQSVWEHHFVFALPLMLLGAAWRGRERPGALALAGLLVFGLPTFDLFPLSYHRAAGLLLLLGLTRPPR